jgi:phosphoenolpyruvate carboxykinase (ATP)
MLDPIIYANELTRKMKMHDAEAWLVNTGWMAGPYGTGNRIDLPSTRKIINAILDNSINNSEFITLPVFNLSIPTKMNGVDESLLNPSKAWESPLRWHISATDLALKFINNFSKFTGNKETEMLADHGPRI